MVLLLGLAQDEAGDVVVGDDLEVLVVLYLLEVGVEQ